MASPIERHGSEIVEGFLKQQYVDANGQFVWEKKLFTLDIARLELHIQETDKTTEAQSSLSLKGVKYAKEWSFSSSVSGYGFDLVWFSGKLWSFFAEDEPMSKRWVSSINQALKDSTAHFEHKKDSSQNDSFHSYATLNETKMEAASPMYLTPYSVPPTATKFNPVGMNNLSVTSTAHSRDGRSIESRSVASKRYENTAAEHEYPLYPSSVHSTELYGGSHAATAGSSSMHSQQTSQYGDLHSTQHGSIPTSRSVVSSQTRQTRGDNHAPSYESVHSQSFSVHSQSLLIQGQEHQSQSDTRSQHLDAASSSHDRDDRSHPSEEKSSAQSRPHSGASVRSAQSQPQSVHSASIKQPPAHNPHTPSHSVDTSQFEDTQSIPGLPHYPTSASVHSQHSAQGGDLASQALGRVTFPAGVAGSHDAFHVERQEHGFPHFPTGVSVSSHAPSEHTSADKDLQHSDARSEQNRAPHFPSGASVNTLLSYEQSLLRTANEQSSQAHGHVNFPAGVASRSVDHTHHTFHTAESTRPPVYPSSASVVSALTHDVSHHPKGAHAPSSGSVRSGPVHSQIADEQSRHSQQSFHHSVQSAQNKETSASSQRSSSEPERSVHDEHEHDHSDQESEIHHRHYARVHPHAEGYASSLPPLHSSASHDSHAQDSSVLRSQARDSNFPNTPHYLGDEESSFGGSSYDASRPFSFADHESMLSSQQPSVGASASSYNIQQRLLFGKATSAPPSSSSTQHPPAVPSAALLSSAPLRRSLDELPQSVQMSARMDIQRELSAHEVAKERPSVQAFAHEAQALHAKCQLLEVQLQRKEGEVDILKQRMTQQQDRFDQSCAEFEQRLDLARDKERQLISESKREMENKLLRASNDNMSFFDAANKSMRLQHERELSCLREELQEERKRHSNLLDRSQSLRERAERAEAETQQELATLKDKHSMLVVESARLKREFEIERSGFESERKHLIHEAQSTITALQEEKEQVMVQAHQQLRDKITEMNEKMQHSLDSIKDSDAEILRQEMEGQRIRSLAELHKKCQREIEIVRTEERRLAAIEMENIRTAFLSREHQTSEDLIQLEKLHSTRVSQLEKQVLALKADNTTCNEQLKIASKEAHYGSSQVQRAATEMQMCMEDHAARAEELQREVVAVHKEIQEGKVREASYRDQLSRALTESRMQHAELLEARQQASTGSAQAFQWRNATRESDVSIAAADTAVRIARDEITMLEHQLKRVETENLELKSELQRADRLIYGANLTNNQHALNDAGSLNFNNTATLSTKHLLRSSLSGSFYQSATTELMNPTVSSLAKSAKTRKAVTPKR